MKKIDNTGTHTHASQLRKKYIFLRLKTPPHFAKCLKQL